ncbi:MAG: dihydrolipoamide acetyltransferase family protein [Bacillota bacterium]
MATPVIMPRQGQSVESCIITKWFKAKGDKVAVGDLLFNYETDKAAFDEESKVEGTVLAIYYVEGDDVPCLTNVCVIGNEGENIDEFNPSSDSAQAPTPEPSAQAHSASPQSADATAASAETLTSSPTSAQATSGELKISPRAKNLAQKHGVDYRKAAPSGPNGRIIEQDIRKLIDSGILVTSAASDEYLSSQKSAEGTGLGGRVRTSDLAEASVMTAEVEEVKLSNIRKVIAKAMHNSLSTMAQLTLNSSFDATDVLSYREKIKVGMDKTGVGNITINDMILYAVAKTLESHRDLNAHYFDDKMLLFKSVNLGIAVDTPRGLMVPTLFGSNSKTLNQLSTDAKALIEACQKGTISPDSLKGGTFTVTNLGALGIESFTPVINPPQTGILGVNTIEIKAKEVDGKIIHYKSIGLSLTFDHRALDGAPAAKFLKELATNLENFSAILAK